MIYWRRAFLTNIFRLAILCGLPLGSDSSDCTSTGLYYFFSRDAAKITRVDMYMSGVTVFGSTMFLSFRKPKKMLLFTLPALTRRVVEGLCLLGLVVRYWVISVSVSEFLVGWESG